MQANQKTFRTILQDSAKENARRLEGKARQASWLAKVETECASRLYELKHDAIRQLFRIPGRAPVIRDAWISGRGYLLSIRLHETRALLHVPFEELRIVNQQAHGAWVADRARGKRWLRAA